MSDNGSHLNLEVRDLRMVLAVAAEGSLTQAGLQLNVSQPALSRHLATLESRLGTALFSRTGQRMVATPAGELLLRHARDVVDRVTATESLLRELRSTPRQKLRVGTECYTGYHWLPTVMNRYTARHPSVEVEIAFEAARKPMNALRDGTIDVAILTSGTPRTGFQVTQLFPDEYIAVVAPGHPWAGRGFVEATDFAKQRVLLMVPAAMSTVMQQFIKPANVRPKLVADVQLIGAIAALAEGGYGVGMVPNWTIAPEIRSGRLVAVRLGRNGLRRMWSAAIPQSHAREVWLQDFVRSMATGGPSMTASTFAAS